MSRPDRRAAKPALTPLEGRQLLTAGVATRPLAVQAFRPVVSRAIAMPPTFAPIAGSAVATSLVGPAGTTLRVAAPTGAAAGRGAIPYAVAPTPAATELALGHLGPATRSALGVVRMG